MAKFFCARVSTKDQNLARQLMEARKHADIPDENIYCDKISGRKFERPQYDAMKARLQPGDEVYFKELDRIGRNKGAIKEELKWFKDHGVLVRILDVPTTLMEITPGQEWLWDMVNNILIEVLGAMAEQEWEKTTKRRQEGIEAMPLDEDGRKVSSKTGRGFGRPELAVDLSLQKGETVASACARLGISRNTYYRKLREANALV